MQLIIGRLLMDEEFCQLFLGRSARSAQTRSAIRDSSGRAARSKHSFERNGRFGSPPRSNRGPEVDAYVRRVGRNPAD
jgi:hypothetical protein